jgi:hypothetical protein
MVILQDKYGLHRVAWGYETRTGKDLKHAVTRQPQVKAILNCLIYAELLDAEIKKIQDTEEMGIFSYWKVTRERIDTLREALRERLKEPIKREASA